MRVTIIADASFCPSGCAGYGYWIASERGKRPGGGPVDRKVDTSAAAEMIALLYALREAVEHKYVQAGDHVLLQTDCEAAILAYESVRDRLSKSERWAKSEFYSLKSQVRCTVSFRHVKGHSKEQKARYITNNLCDMRAREGLRLARQKDIII